MTATHDQPGTVGRIVGIDVGGTFTDLTVFDPVSGETVAVKSPSVRHAPDEGVLAALKKADVDLAEVALIVHGTTVATNALLERRGAKTAMVTTEGFRDVIELGRTTRLTPNTLYDPYFERTPPLVRRRDRHTVRERINGDGAIETPLDEAATERLAERLAEEGFESVAIGFLNAYANPAHEAQAAAIFRRHFTHVSVSHEVLNEIREYERFSTTVINAYLQPLVASYTERLVTALKAANYGGAFYTTASNGGLLNEADVAARPVRTVLSGPAGGVAAAHYVAEQIGRSSFVTYDMGGTSSDVALVADGAWPVKRESILEGLLVKVPQLDIHTIGAGGGSIAVLDEGGGLFVGPQSAGARPGPAAYGHGGTAATVTDANVVLGRIGAGQSLGGSLTIDAEAARTAVGALATTAGLSVEEMALGILDIAVTKMATAIHEISIARGYDPRDLALMPFGGAGPLHACAIADELGIPEVVIPPLPGAFSAFGGFCAAPFKERQVTVLLPLDDDAPAKLQAHAKEIVADLRHAFTQEGHDPDRVVLRHEVDCRYQGQSHELTIVARLDCVETISGPFEEEFERQFARLDPDRSIEVVNLRVVAALTTTPPPLPDRAPGDVPAPTGERAVTTHEGTDPCPVMARDGLPAGATINGPLVVEEMSSTTFVPTHWSLSVGRHGELVLTQRAEASNGHTRHREAATV
ncbi:MAG: hydantoinase/oxoprolinase family protein [Pseudomonadota bacterium]